MKLSFLYIHCNSRVEPSPSLRTSSLFETSRFPNLAAIVSRWHSTTQSYLIRRKLKEGVRETLLFSLMGVGFIQYLIIQCERWSYGDQIVDIRICKDLQ